MAGSRYPGRASATDAVFTFPYAMPADFINSASLSTATSITVWTPGTNNKFRLMGVHIALSGGAIQTTAGDILMSLMDGGTAGTTILSQHVYVPAAASGANIVLVNVRFNGGYLSSAENNVLTLMLGSAMTGGYVSCVAWGLEEG